jgi:subtilisin family serine protease
MQWPAAIKAYRIDADPSATATINEATIVFDAPAPFTAAFSSRGPLLAGGGDLLKPDVIAPGVDVLAAVAPPGNHGFDFNLYSGTSMSSPHVAGLAALLKDLHPDWSPMAIKSALMTTGYDVLDGGTPAPNTNPVLIFRQGAGHVQPNSAMDPGLVYDSDFLDWLAFLCGSTTGVNPATCTALAGLGLFV